MPNETVEAAPIPNHGQKAPMRRDDIPGWGSDLDRARRPAVPMERMPARLDSQLAPLVQQHGHTEVLVSPERPGITPLYGTSVPPRGLSGILRRNAYRHTESDLRHWLILLLADRVDAIEGVAKDLRHGHIPNVVSEMGLPAVWRHNPSGLVRKAVLSAAVIGVGWWLLKTRSSNSRS